MVGVDIVAIARIERLLKKYNISFLKNFLRKSEIDLCIKGRESSDFCDLSCFNVERIAGFYAAKEAIAKALRCGISKNLTFKDIILSKDFQGAPKAKLSKRAKKHFKVKKIHISISHDRARIRGKDLPKDSRGKDLRKDSQDLHDSRDNDSHKDSHDSQHKNIAPQGFAIAFAMIQTQK